VAADAKADWPAAPGAPLVERADRDLQVGGDVLDGQEGLEGNSGAGRHVQQYDEFAQQLTVFAP